MQPVFTKCFESNPELKEEIKIERFSNFKRYFQNLNNVVYFKIK